MRPFSSALLLVLAAATAAPAQTIIYVDGNRTTNGDGTSWITAFNNLGSGLAAANSGDHVWVATAGFYNGPFTIPAGVTVIGQFIGDQTAAGGPPGHISTLQRSVANRTLLSGGGTQRVVTMGQGSVLDGFDLKFGLAAAPGGGGALVDGVSCTFRNCAFSLNNDSAGSGAAVLIRNGGNARLETCLLFANGDASSGAAIDVDGSTATLLNLTVDFSFNSAVRLQNGASAQIFNCALTNSGGGAAGAYGVEQVDTSVDPTLRNNLFFANKDGLYLRGASALTTIGQVNGLSFSQANLAADPLYVGLNNYRLQAGSPCIDAGTAALPYTGARGFYDEPRQLDGDMNANMAPDIGCTERTDVTLTIPVDTHKHIHLGVGGTANLPAFVLIDIAPNPPGLLLPPVGYIFEGLVTPLVLPYGSIPTQASQVILYPPGVIPGVPLYFQALTTNGVGIQISNPQVHITN